MTSLAQNAAAGASARSAANADGKSPVSATYPAAAKPTLKAVPVARLVIDDRAPQGMR